MDAVILASGEGKRMRPLTETTPKPLLKALGAPLLDHLIRALPESITRIILSTHYLGEQFKERYGSSWKGRDILYAEGDLAGNARGFIAAEPLIRGERFLVAYADDLPSRQDIERCLKHERSILCFETSETGKHGIVSLKEDGTIAEIIEKPSVLPSNLAVNGCMVLDRGIFSCTPKTSHGGELHLSAMVDEYVKNVPVVPVMAEGLIYGISTPQDLVRAEGQLKKRYETEK